MDGGANDDTDEIGMNGCRTQIKNTVVNVQRNQETDFFLFL